MVFEVMGENLLALVKYHDYHGLPINIVRRLARHTLLGLEYIHSRGVIHTDVKLENVLVQRHDLADLVREAHRAHRIFTAQKQAGEGLTKSQKKRMKQKQNKQNKTSDVPEAKAEEAAETTEGQPLSKSQKKKANKKKQKNGEAKGEAADGIDSDIEEPATAACGKDTKANDGDDNESDDDRAAAEACGRPVPPVRQKERFKTFGAPQVFAKLADFGNGCRVDRKVTDDIQTRQYRSPEVIIGAEWDETADLWSAACMFFELITGDFLFDPRTGENWSRNEDHLALITELISDCTSKDFLLSGKYSKEFYSNAGKLKHIKSLKYWSLQRVLTDKYKWSEEEADEVAEFLLPMLAWQPKSRCTAAQALQHFWVKPMPGEVDIPDPEKFNVSYSSTEAETPPIEASKGQVAQPAEASPGNDVENREAASSAPAVADAGPETLIGLLHAMPPADVKREAPEAAAPETVAPEPLEAAVPAPASTAEESQTTSSASAAAVTASPATAAEPEANQLPEPTEGDTTQDCSQGGAEVTEASGPASTEVAAPASKEVQAAKAAVCEGADLDDFVDLMSLDLSDSTSLVAALEPSACADVARLSLDVGFECKRLDERHLIVLIKPGASTAVVGAARLARKAQGVNEWMSLEDYQATLPTDADVEGGDDKPKKKKNNKKNKGKK